MSVGSIEKRGSNSYRLTVSGGFDPFGKRIKYQKTVKAKSDRAAQKELALFVAEIESGSIQAAKVPVLTFAQSSNMYLENYALTNLSGTTISEPKRMASFS